MKITDIKIDSFGHWKGLQVPGISSGVTVICGPNEAGKSTLLHLIRAVLYGFSAGHHARFVPPKFSGDVGGRLTVGNGLGSYELRRWLGAERLTADTQGELEIRSLNGGVQGKHLLNSLRGGVDVAIFRNVFAIGLTEMQQLATLSDTEAAQQLYGLAAGVDRVSISDVARDLTKARDQLIQDSNASGLHALIQERDQLRVDVDHEQGATQRWLKLVDEHRAVDGEVTKFQRRQGRLSAPLRDPARRKEVRQQWKRAKQCHRKILAIGPLTDIPADVVRRLKATSKQIGECRTAWEKLRDQRRRLREEGRQLVSPATLLHYADEIQQLNQRAAWTASLVEQVNQLKADVEETEFEMHGEFERVGLVSGQRAEPLLVVTDQMVTQLREPAATVQHAVDQLKAAETEIHDGRRVVEKLQRELADEMKDSSFDDLDTAWRKTQQLAGLLKQRIQVEGQMESTRRSLKDCRRDGNRWSRKQLLPWRGLMMIGMAFSIGAILLLTATFGDFFEISGDQRWSMAFVGGALAVGVMLMKSLIEFTARRGLDASRGEAKQLQKQVERHSDEVTRLDSLLPPSTEPFAVRLHQVNEDMERLSELDPLEQQRVVSVKRVELSEDQFEAAERHLEESQLEWQENLRVHGLPDTMTPRQFREISQPDSAVFKIRHRYAESHEGYLEKKAELDSIRERVETIFERTGMGPEGERLEAHIDQLNQAMEAARDRRQQRDSLYRKWRDAGREQSRIAREAKRLQGRRRRLVARYGVVDSQELKTMFKRRKQATELSGKRDALLESLAGELGSCCTKKQLRKCLGDGDFELQLSTWEKEHDDVAEKLAHLLERRGELGQQIKHLASQRQCQHKRLQLREVDAQLIKKSEQWRMLAATGLLLDNVRKCYESDRQPETLAEASGYLKQLTSDSYQRIWTPCGEPSLYVDDENGRPVLVEHLSRGTREQVFLSLRLALAAAYGRRGVQLPLILDDVFVNFDAQRARAAAETICQFALAGHQVLVFSCHDHIRRVFQALDVDVRRLPAADGNPQPVLPMVDEQVDEPATVPVEPVGLPLENDPELDHELMFGVPEYDPGYRADLKELTVEAVEINERSTLPRRPSQWQVISEQAPVDLRAVSSGHGRR